MTSSLLSQEESKSFGAFLDSMAAPTEDERQKQLREQVADLQSWCDRNQIISKEPLLAGLRLGNTPPRTLNFESMAETLGPVASTSTLAPSLAVASPPRPTKRSRPTSIKGKQAVKQEMDEDSSGDAPLNGSAKRSDASQRLLTDAERRANHIASEQKRRAAIREGYDQLALTVPVLRDAIREYESRVAANNSPSTRGSSGRRKKSMSIAGPLQGGIEVGGEKIDGRAGPKSEAIVLTQTVEYLKTLQDQRDDLLARLERVRQMALRSGIDTGPVEAIWAQKWEDQDHGMEDLHGSGSF